jgi:hypothetical protein
MRGTDSYNENLLTTVRLKDFVLATHPLRPIRTWVNDALAKMDGKLSAMYAVDIKATRPKTSAVSRAATTRTRPWASRPRAV